ncbi:AroM family protein [Natrialbaceae archaeon A-chndr2]
MSTDAVGFVTIGQAPRTDVTPEILAHFPEDTEVIEVGGLDGYEDAAAVEADLAPAAGAPQFVTRLTDGSEVIVDRAASHDLVAERITDIEDDVSVIGLLCTGSFPDLEASVPVLTPSSLLHAWTRAIDPDRLGVIMPKAEQSDQTADKWADEFDVVAAAGTPYGDGHEVGEAADELGSDVDLVVMDCIGYNEAMRETVRERTGASVLLGRSVLAKTMTELR